MSYLAETYLAIIPSTLSFVDFRISLSACLVFIRCSHIISRGHLGFSYLVWPYLTFIPANIFFDSVVSRSQPVSRLSDTKLIIPHGHLACSHLVWSYLAFIPTGIFFVDIIEKVKREIDPSETVTSKQSRRLLFFCTLIAWYLARGYLAFIPASIFFERRSISLPACLAFTRCS